MRTASMSSRGALLGLLLSMGVALACVAPRAVESRTIDLEQTVTLRDIPPGARQVRLWVPVPGDAPWQRVLDLSVKQAPKGWKLVPQSDGRGRFIYAEALGPFHGPVSVTVACRVVREAVVADLSQASGPVDPALFVQELDTRAPLMEGDEKVAKMAADACGTETDVARQARLLMQAVVTYADHYSKDASKPHCGRGSAQDCIEHGGGCCTDLHSLFVAMARSRGIPARIQYGYRVLDAKAGAAFDPGYRCWVEVFVPGSGWVPTDLVAADGAGDTRFGSLSATRVWLWAGRSFELQPPAAHGRVDTMICGWAEIDGQAVDPLPAADGSPSKLTRTVRFNVVERARDEGAAPIPE